MMKGCSNEVPRLRLMVHFGKYVNATSAYVNKHSARIRRLYRQFSHPGACLNCMFLLPCAVELIVRVMLAFSLAHTEANQRHDENNHLSIGPPFRLDQVGQFLPNREHRSWSLQRCTRPELPVSTMNMFPCLHI